MCLVLSIEAGGTKSDCMVSDMKGKIVGFNTGSSGNPLYINKNDIINNIRNSILAAMENSMTPLLEISQCFITNYGSSDFAYQITDGLIDRQKVKVISEMDAAIDSVALGKPAAVAMSGTGSFAYAKSIEGKTMYIGGLGSIIGDEGSGYYIGRMCIQKCIYALDGRGESTKMTELLCTQWGIDNESLSSHEIIWEIANRIYNNDNYSRAIASLTRVVEKAALLNDEKALGILEDSGEQMALLTASLLKRFDIGKKPVPIGIQGGTWKSGKQMRQSFKNKLLSLYDMPVDFIDKIFKPVVGTYINGLKACGIHTDDEIRDNITNNDYKVCSEAFAQEQMFSAIK